MLNQYLNENALNMQLNEKIEEIIEKSNESNYFGSIYSGYPFIELNNENILSKCILVINKGIFVFYEDENEKRIYRRHLTKIIMESENLSNIYYENKLIFFLKFDDDLNLSNYNNLLDENEITEFDSIIQNMWSLNKKDEREIKDDNTLGSLIKKRNNEINKLDSVQFNAIYKDYNSHTRIRGLAGSGKTILMVKKMAYMHYKDKEKKLCYVFYTKSLRQYIKELFIKFYHDFDKYGKPNFNNIDILHTWGGKSTEGFYYNICKYLNKGPIAFKDINGKNKFDIICQDINKFIGKKRLKVYDQIFIDEAQDLPLSFFHLTLKTLKNNSYLNYAYDEMQTLYKNSIPSKSSIFKNQKCEDIDLKICYRSPKEIITSAHALGLGIYNEVDGQQKLLNMIQDKKVWQAIGYEGDIEYGKNVCLKRIEENKFIPSNIIEIRKKNTLEEQFLEINAILKRLSNDDVIPEDILIIDLDAMNLDNNFFNLRRLLNEKNNCNIHIVNKINFEKFKIPNSIPYTTIFRAKGNEANIVIIINADKYNNAEIYFRNRLFTAMTRAKFKLYILGGNGLENLEKEYGKIVDNNYELNFKYPTKKELNEMETIAKNERQTVIQFEKLKEILNKDDKNIELLKSLIMEEFGDEE